MPFAPSLCRPIICAVALSAAPAALAETPRELLTTAAFQTSDKARALSLISQAISAADRIQDAATLRQLVREGRDKRVQQSAREKLRAVMEGRTIISPLKVVK